VASINSVWKRLLGVERVVVESWDFDEAADALVVRVRAKKRDRLRCPICHLRCARYDGGGGLRRWRALDLGTVQTYLEAEAPRVSCKEHGVIVQDVPWAARQSGFTLDFEDQCAWLAVHTNRTAASELLRIAWRTVGRIVKRVGDDARAHTDLLDGLRRIGIDELSHRKGHKYVTVVVDHDTGRLVWMAPGRDKETLGKFFDALGPERSALLQLVSADGAEWIEDVVRQRAPQATRCLDPFHVVQWATKALDEVRREKWNELRKVGAHGHAKDLKNARWALWKNPENLTPRQEKTLGWLATSNEKLYRAYLLKESLRSVFHLPGAPAVERLDAWQKWAQRSRIPPFVKLASSIRSYRPAIVATIAHRLSNAIVEAKNTQLRLLLRQAFGFHHVEAFISLAMLKLADLCPPLPGRRHPRMD